MFAAFKIVLQKKLVPETDVVTVQFWTSLGGLVISAVVMAIPSQWPRLPEGKSTMSDWLLLLAHAFSTGIAQMLIFKSQQMVSAIMSGLAMSFDVIFTLIGQYTLLYHIQPGHKNDLEKYGAAVVLVSIIVVPVWGICRQEMLSEQTELPANRTQSKQQCRKKCRQIKILNENRKKSVFGCYFYVLTDFILFLRVWLQRAQVRMLCCC